MIQIDASVLIALNKISSDKELVNRPVLTCVHVKRECAKVHATATDSYCIGKFCFVQAGDSEEFLVPSDSIKQLSAKDGLVAITNTGEECTLTTAQKTIRFKREDYTFPDTESVFKQGVTNAENTNINKSYFNLSYVSKLCEVCKQGFGLRKNEALPLEFCFTGVQDHAALLIRNKKKLELKFRGLIMPLNPRNFENN